MTRQLRIETYKWVVELTIMTTAKKNWNLRLCRYDFVTIKEIKEIDDAVEIDWLAKHC